jgi:hypothetical protein
MNSPKLSYPFSAFYAGEQSGFFLHTGLVLHYQRPFLFRKCATGNSTAN